MNLKKKISTLPLLPLHISGLLSLVVLIAATLWSHTSVQVPVLPEENARRIQQQREISGVYFSSVQNGADSAEKEIPKRFRKNPAFQLFLKIEKTVERL